MSNFVFVLDTNLQPLNPIPPGRARRLLKQSLAAVYRRYPFTIVLKYSVPNPETQPHQIKIDPGSKTTGIAIIQGEDKVIWGAEIKHRGQQIKSDLESRSAVRRNRRSRKTRYRKCRFHRQGRQGWLPPSLQSRVENTITWVNRIRRYVPVTGISQELVSFDIQSMQNPEISGKEYQQGELAGYEVRQYLLEKWCRKCAYCGVENVAFEIEHIKAKSKGGSSSVSNLTLSCHKCNQAKGNRDIKDFLKNQPDVLEKILTYCKQPLHHAAAVNATKNKLLRRLQATGLVTLTGSGGQTKYNRTRLELPKSHWVDAACVGNVEKLKLLTSVPLLITAKGWGTRQMCTTNKQGFTIRHRTRCKVFFGFQTGDMVRAILPTGKFAGTHVGRVTVRKSGVFEMSTPKGKVSPVNHKYCTCVHRNDGYMYSFSTNVQ